MTTTPQPSCPPTDLGGSCWHVLAENVFDGHRLSEEEGLAVLASPDCELLDLLGTLPIGLLKLRRVEPLALGAGHLVACRILFALESLDLRQEPTPARFEHSQVFELARQIDAPLLQGDPDGPDARRGPPFVQVVAEFHPGGSA